MIVRASKGSILPVLGLLLAFGGVRTNACATCVGATDSALAEGMNFGILTLLVVIVSVLAGVASFFVYLARRSGSLPEAGAAAVSPTSVNLS